MHDHSLDDSGVFDHLTGAVRRSGAMSTAEIKARIEAMFADDRRPVSRTGAR